MPLRIGLVPYGRSALDFLDASLIGERSDDSLVPVTVIAPNARAAIHLRHELTRLAAAAGRGGLANVSFTVLTRVAHGLAGAGLHAASLRPLDQATLAAAIRSELAVREGVLARLAAHRSTEEELTARYRELRDVDDAALHRLAEGGYLVAELVSVFRAVRARLSPTTYDDDDLCLAAAARAKEQRERDGLGIVIIHLPGQLRRSEQQLLVAVGEAGRAVVHVGVLDDAAADAAGRELCEALARNGALHKDTMSGVELAVAGGATYATHVPLDDVVVAPDPDAEVREAVALLAARADAGARPERLGLAYCATSPYVRLCSQHLAAARLPFSAPSANKVASTPPARFVSALLALGTQGMSRARLMDLGASGALRDTSGVGVRVEEWDRCSRLAGLTEGTLASFQLSLSLLANRAETELNGLGAQAHSASASTSWRIARARRTRDGSAGLLVFLDDLRPTLEALRTDRSWAGLASLCMQALDRHLLAEGDLLSVGADSRARVVGILQVLATLDGKGPPATLADFAQAFDVACSESTRRSGHAGFGVVVGPLGSFGALDLDCIVVVGCTEGNLPRGAFGSPLLKSSDRERAGMPPMGPAAVAERDYRSFRIACAAARERVVMMPRFDALTRRVQTKSRFLPRTGEVIAPGLLASLSRLALGEQYSPDDVARSCAELLAYVERGGDPRRHELVRSQPALADGMHVVTERRMKNFGSFVGRVPDAEAQHALINEPFGPTTLESFATCPMRFFLGHALGCEVLEEPERRWTIDPRDRGLIVHEVLERFVAGLIDIDGTGTERDDEQPDDEARLEAILWDVTSHFERLGRTGKRVLWELERRRLFAAVHEERRRDESRRAARGISPIAVEHAFGYGEVAPVEVAVAQKPLRFRGRIDRIDRSHDGSLVVIDYKTGNPAPFKSMQQDPLDRGRRLQLPVYALAARDAFETDGAGIEALYRFVGDQAVDVPFVLDDASLKDVQRTLGVLVSTIDDGCFPYHPGQTSFEGYENCRVCDFDDVCPADRHRYWERASTQSILSPYAALADGLVEKGADT